MRSLCQILSIIYVFLFTAHSVSAGWGDDDDDWDNNDDWDDFEDRFDDFQ